MSLRLPGAGGAKRHTLYSCQKHAPLSPSKPQAGLETHGGVRGHYCTECDSMSTILPWAPMYLFKELHGRTDGFRLMHAIARGQQVSVCVCLCVCVRDGYNWGGGGSPFPPPHIVTKRHDIRHKKYRGALWMSQ